MSRCSAIYPRFKNQKDETQLRSSDTKLIGKRKSPDSDGCSQNLGNNTFGWKWVSNDKDSYQLKRFVKVKSKKTETLTVPVKKRKSNEDIEFLKIKELVDDFNASKNDSPLSELCDSPQQDDFILRYLLYLFVLPFILYIFYLIPVFRETIFAFSQLDIQMNISLITHIILNNYKPFLFKYISYYLRLFGQNIIEFSNNI